MSYVYKRQESLSSRICTSMTALDVAFAVFSIPFISTLKARFVYNGDISFPARDSVLSETLARPDVNTLTYCADQCLLRPQCKSIEICPQVNNIVCRLCNYTNPKYTSNKTEVCHHLERVTASDNCRLDKCDGKDGTYWTAIEERMSALEKQIKEAKRMNSRVIVSFYAYLQKTIPKPTSGTTVVFNVVETNEGGGFNGSTGEFIVPEGEDGVYVFSWTISSQNGWVFTALRVNSTDFGHIMTDAQGQFNAVTGVVVTKVRKGDRVYVQTNAPEPTSNIISYPDQKTSFSGWKLN